MQPKSQLKLVKDVDAGAVLLGRWKNELHSTMTIDKANAGVFSGTYVSEVSETGEEVQGPLSGIYADDAIAFMVNWGDPVTGWVGRLLTDDDGDFYLYTLWNLAQHTDAPDWWESIKAGSDTFYKID